jgi:hypothetical protein
MPRATRTLSIPPHVVRQYADDDQGGGPVQYLLLIYGPESHWGALTEAESGALMGEYMTFTESIRAQGIMEGGAPLESTATAKTVRVREGRMTVSDGPFAETREQLGGFYLVDCETEQEALDAAARIPNARFGSIEVRPVAQLPTPAP